MNLIDVHVHVQSETTSVSLQVPAEGPRSVEQELVLTNRNREIHTSQVGLSIGEAHPVERTNNDWETTTSAKTSLAHVRAEIRGAGVASKRTNHDFLSRNAHNQRAETLD